MLPKPLAAVRGADTAIWRQSSRVGCNKPGDMRKSSDALKEVAIRRPATWWHFAMAAGIS
jgi:hypothetical protein